MIRQLNWNIGTEWDCVDVTFKCDVFKERKEMNEWLMEYEGKGGYYYNNDLEYNLFYFEYEEDAIMFALRWS